MTASGKGEGRVLEEGQMSRGMVLALALACLCAGGAVQCFLKAAELRSEAEWLMARGNAQANEYAASFDSSIADRQLSTFEQRRQVLDRAHVWQRGQLVLVLATVISVFACYVFYLLRRLREQLADATSEEKLDPPMAGRPQQVAAIPIRVK